MKKAICMTLAFLFLLTFAGCSRKNAESDSIVGCWETQTEISILGHSESDEKGSQTADAIYRFEFLANGTGCSHIIIQQKDSDRIPDTFSNFTYTLNENTLEITYESGNNQTFTITFAEEMLILDGRAHMELTRTD